MMCGPKPGVLAPYRVLDLTDETGVFCTKTLAALGADVIKIERPSGDAARTLGPFYHDLPSPETSLHWFLYNLDKRSITLNLESSDGRKLFKRLAQTAHFMVECFKPGYLDALGLGYEGLSETNPSIIVTSITPFGQTGPYKDFKGSHLICSALGGLLYVCGGRDTPPVQVSLPTSSLIAGSYAAAATMAAHYYRGSTGEGQHVDVAIQECVTSWVHGHIYWKSHGMIMLRDPSGPYSPGERYERRLFPCKDGYITSYVTYWPGRDRLRDWLDSEGIAGDLFDERWKAIFTEGAPITLEEKSHVYELFERFCLRHTRAELYEGAQRRGVQICPVNSVKEVAEDVHLASREYFIEVEHPELGTTISYQGAPYRSSVTPWKLSRRAPLVGEHNDDVYMGELGLSRQGMLALRQSGVI